MSMSNHAICPKCACNARYEVVGEVDLVLLCLCGYYAVVYTEIGDITTISIDRIAKSNTPSLDTKIGKCMKALLNNYPRVLTSEQVYSVVKKSMGRSDASTNLMLLQHKGLVDKLTFNKGMAGGSSWKISDYGKSVYDIKE